MVDCFSRLDIFLGVGDIDELDCDKSLLTIIDNEIVSLTFQALEGNVIDDKKLRQTLLEEDSKNSEEEINSLIQTAHNKFELV